MSDVGMRYIPTQPKQSMKLEAIIQRNVLLFMQLID